MIHIDDRQRLQELHTAAQSKQTLHGCSLGAAAFLTIGALIVIGCASLCLTLPGVNALTQVILPGVVPGAGALLLSFPLLYVGARTKGDADRTRQELIDFHLGLLTHYRVAEKPKKEAVAFIEENLLHKDDSKPFSSKLLGDLKERLPDEKEEGAFKALHPALDKARVRLNTRKKTRS